MASAIEIRSLRVVRGGRVVLSSISLEIESGRVIGLLGPSGSGKTTLMRAIVGVQIVAGGEVRVLGEPAGTPSLRARVGYMTQAPSVYADLNVEENLRYFARVLDVAPERVEAVLEAVDLQAHAEQVVSTLSGGERARVLLATALLNEPPVLVLDEPTVGLDPLLRRDLWKLFHQIAEAGTTLLVSSHVMDEADRCDELVLLREGQVLATGTPEGLRQRVGATEMEEVFLRLIEEAA